MSQCVRLLVVVSLTFAACGTAVQAAAPPALDQRLLKPGEFTGFEVEPAQTFTNALEWASLEGIGDTTGEQHWLERHGFVAGAFAQLATPKLSHRSALSYVVRFRAAAGARADVARRLKPAPPAGVKMSTFAVTGIPGAHGLAFVGSGGRRYFVSFSDGPFSYGVWAFTTKPDDPLPTAAQLAAAALRLYERIRGVPA